MKNTRIKRLVLIALGLVVGFFLLYPIVNTLVRYFTLLSIGVLWAYVLWLVWGNRRLRIGFLCFSLLLPALLATNGREVPAAEFRMTYARALIGYEGTPYVWGGENWLGIDCSGLVRAAMIDTNLRLGLLSLSPQYLRKAFFIWFHDAGADTLAAGFREQTRHVLKTPSLNDVDYARLAQGDVMVDSNGVHTMVYLGDRTWIEADPMQSKVIRVRVPSEIGWFKIPVSIVRWRQLDQQPG
ncbi:MAG TPA: NlpC/P60 family protein [Candidatus Obscuribacterales bacterium]